MAALLRPRSAAAALLLVAMATAGCSDDSSDAASADPTGSVTPSSSPSLPSGPATPSASPKPELPRRPAAEDTDAGRRAFAQFVIDRWGYALQTNDAAAVTGLSPTSAPCEGCDALEKELSKRAKQGWHVDFPGVRVHQIQLSPAPPGAAPDGQPAQVAEARVDIPPSKSYFEDGELRNRNQAHPGATFQVLMRRDGNRFVLLAFGVS
jgi:hypothetical protein